MKRGKRHFLCHEGGHGESGHAGGSHGHDHAHEHDHDHPHPHVHQNTKQVLNRLSRITGHLNAVKTMVETGRDCSEVLIQLAAVQSALNGVCQVILEDHIDHCIVDAVQNGDMAAIEELNKAIKTLMKK